MGAPERPQPWAGLGSEDTHASMYALLEASNNDGLVDEGLLINGGSIVSLPPPRQQLEAHWEQEFDPPARIVSKRSGVPASTRERAGRAVESSPDLSSAAVGDRVSSAPS